MNATYGSSQSRYTVWHFIGCGCTVLVLLGLLVAGGAIFFGKQMVEGIKAGIEDPEVRAARAREILGYEDLPEGYYPGISISFPFVMQMAALGDHELPDSEDLSKNEMESEIARSLFGQRGFFFVKVRGKGGDESEGDLASEMNIDLDFDLDRALADGSVEAGGGEVSFVAHSGTIRGGDERLPAIINEMVVTCLSDPYGRKALWFVAVSEEMNERFVPTEAVEPEDVVGTPADPEAVKAFLDHFDLCR